MENLFGEEVVRKVKIDRDILLDAIKDAFPEHMTSEKLVSMMYSKYEAAIDFSLLCNGERSGQKISLLFNPHRLETRAMRRKSIVDAFRTKKSFLDGVARASIFRLNDTKNTRNLLYRLLETGVNGVQYVNEFPPSIARDHFISFNAKHILDPCAGWGGRMIGAASVGSYYSAYEPATKTYQGLIKLGEWLKRFKTGFDFQVINKPFEDADVRGQFDLAYTSPPYYDTEIYSDEETNSCNRYSTYETWLQHFYIPMIHKAVSASRNGLILNVGFRSYDLIKPIDGFEVREIRSTLSGKAGIRKTGKGEKFFLVKKRGRK